MKSVKQFGIQIRQGLFSGLIWAQIVCKDYQQMTNVALRSSQIFLNARIISTIILAYEIVHK